MTVCETMQNIWENAKPVVTSKLFLDWIVLAILEAIAIAIEFSNSPMHHRGFHCNDPQLSYKFHGEDVTPVILICITGPLPLLIFWVAEFIACRSFKQSFPRAFRIYTDYMLGKAFSLGVSCIAKSTFGGLRPTFFDTCKPDKMANCTTGEFIYEFECTNKKFSKFYARQARRSFPSGHATMTFHHALFTSWHLEKRFCKTHFNPLVLLIHFVGLSWAAYCSMSRISDYTHHWWDVLSGVLIGLATVYLTVKVISKDFDYLECPIKEEMVEQQQQQQQYNQVVNNNWDKLSVVPQNY